MIPHMPSGPAPATAPAGHAPAEVLRRARREAERYGEDPWVFLRELVQNGRDAGAARIALVTETANGVERLSCSDDGAGMSRALVEEGLLRLFSSRKQSDGAAGCFGVGFWSVLRFDPASVRVDTHDGARAVAIAIDVETGAVSEVEPARTERGTTVTLERAAREPRFAALAFAAVRRMCGCLTSLPGRPRPVVTVDGRVVRRTMQEAFEPADPQVAVKGGGFSGTVGFSRRPRVEIYVHGLLVKEALSLDELVPSRGRKRRALPGLFPMVTLEAPGVTLLLDRMEIVEDSLLRQLVELCEQALADLLADLLDTLVPLPFLARLRQSVARHALVVGLSCVGAPAVLAAGVAVARVVAPAPAPSQTAVLLEDVRPTQAPHVDDLDLSGPSFAVTVHTAEPLLFLRLGVLERLDEARGLVAAPRPREPVASARGPVVAEVSFRAHGTPVPLPAAAGTAPAVDGPGEGGPGEGGALFGDGRGLVWLARASGEGIVRYRLVRTPSTPPPPFPARVALPDELKRVALSLSVLSERERIDGAVAFVRRRLRYGADAATRRAVEGGSGGFFERVLAAGAGDCDVMNAVLVAVLVESGVNARLATGLVVQDGVVAPLQHAWAEAFVDGTVVVADASPPLELPSSTSSTSSRSSDGTPPAGASAAPSAARAAARAAAVGRAAVDPRAAPDAHDNRERGAGDRRAIGDDDGRYVRAGGSRPLPPAPRAVDGAGPLTRGARALLHGDRRGVVGFVGVVALVDALAVLGALALFGRRRKTAARARVDLSSLFALALRRGDKNDPLRLWHRRLLPRLRGRPLSLREAEKLAARGRLSVDRARAAGPVRGAVLMAGDPIVEAVRAGLFGLVDLERAREALTRPVDERARAVQALAARFEPTAAARVVPGSGLVELSLPLPAPRLLVLLGEDDARDVDAAVDLYRRASLWRGRS